MRIRFAMLMLALPAAPLSAQDGSRPAIARLAAVRAELVRVTASHRDALWPGFRPDTIPVLFIVPDRGILLLGWGPGDPPAGFAPVADLAGAGWQPAALHTAASTGASLGGRDVAQVFVFPDADEAQLFGTAAHEAFHVYARSVARDERKFGSGENSFLVSTYPVFDAGNEAGWALEGRLLARALAARTRAELAERTREFVAARETRHRALGSDFAEFETQAELNEGLAEYALVRSLALAADDSAFRWRADAEREVARHRTRLDSLTADVRQSLRLRFYATGPAMGLLLDRLSGPGWRADLVRRDLTLQEMLAEASGYRDPERALLRGAARAVDTASLGRAAREGVARLRTIRRAQADSVLARPGLTILLRADSLPGARFGLCGIDPQNLLQVDSDVLLHTRWVRPCGPGLSAEFTTAAVQNRRAGTFTAVVGPADSVRVTAGGRAVAPADGEAATWQDLKVEGPGVVLTAARAMVRWRGATLEVVPLGQQ